MTWCLPPTRQLKSAFFNDKCDVQSFIHGMQHALLLLLLCTLVISCSSNKRQDGPPRYHVDVSRIPNATPKHEPLAKYGNMPSYKVFGKRYYVMRNVQNYEATGTASWYGTLFHKRKTSSGEPYDMLGMTAAHKTLPLPTYVEVTNLANNRKVVVKVNDRGPFSGNRLIDLSYVAAKKLGMLGRGTAHVRVRAIDPHTYGRPLYIARNPGYRQRTTVTTTTTTVARVGTVYKPKIVYLQAGAFRNRGNAIRLQKQLAGLLTAPIIISPQSHLYRVKIGPIHDYATANKISHQLRGMGIQTNESDGA